MVSISQASDQGSRPEMEDRWVSIPLDGGEPGHLIAVFDGHRGSAAADVAAKLVLPKFSEALHKHPGDLAAAMRALFAGLVEATAMMTAGSTASIVFLSEKRREACWGALGDSPMALVDRAGQTHWGPDHNARTNPKELMEARRRGALYSRGYLQDPQNPGIGLQMGRSLGDRDLDRILSREPEIETIQLGPDSFGFVASDGILSPLDGPPSAQIPRLMDLLRRGADAAVLLKDALGRITGDNVSVIAWRMSV